MSPSRSAHLSITSLINPWGRVPSRGGGVGELRGAGRRIQEALTLKLSSAQAFLQPLHLILQEADMPHHVLWWVYLHGYISWGGRSRNWLVQLLLEDSGVKTKYLVNRLCQQQWKSHGELGICCLIQIQTTVLVIQGIYWTTRTSEEYHYATPINHYQPFLSLQFVHAFPQPVDQGFLFLL